MQFFTNRFVCAVAVSGLAMTTSAYAEVIRSYSLDSNLNDNNNNATLSVTGGTNAFNSNRLEVRDSASATLTFSGLNLSTYSAVSLTYLTNRSNANGYSTQTVSYSTNGGSSYTQLTAANNPYTTSTGGLSSVTFNLSALNAIANAAVKIELTGGTNNSNAGNDFDSVSFSGTNSAPEPMTAALVGLSGVAVLGRRRQAEKAVTRVD